MHSFHKLILLLCIYISQSVFSREFPGQIVSLPKLGSVAGTQFAGYLPVRNTDCTSNNCAQEQKKIFFWFVASQGNPEKDPIILWLNGGPGASSFYGFFSGNGPYLINSDDNLEINPFSWNKNANYMIMDQPVGVGFSYIENKIQIKNEAEAIDNLYFALKAFFKRYPNLIQNSLYLSGESYAGKYLPELAKKIITEKKANRINLKGIFVGDAWVNPLVQQSSDADYAYSHGLIDEKTKNHLNVLYKQCAYEIKKHYPSSRKANKVCMKIQDMIREVSGGIDLHNIQKKSEDYHRISNYLNRKDVRHVLHIDDRIEKFNLSSKKVENELEVGVQDSVANLYAYLLNTQLRILIYNGIEDGTDCNFMGTEKWLSQLNWDKKSEFLAAPTIVWKMGDNDVAGFIKSASNLTYVKVRGAGHMAASDQPQRLLFLLNQFIK